MNESQKFKASRLQDSQIHEDEHLRGDDLLGHANGGSKTEPSGSVGTVYVQCGCSLDACAYMPGFFLGGG